ncbi:hypothetical protein [Streptomyces hoynatensis]|uniref:Type II toxin-antitoxin system RelE/ParE family toxin n=1 Tax=Streptomyces hoynatensis TaxID=1141874 RepID=A0A3A9YSB3_9ACTN|nr:hypothetical protein [Streptomyces hoynatensis]RKN38941.1 hypothetical protein D7294_22370 [Streptomyces hoynatensis]
MRRCRVVYDPVAEKAHDAMPPRIRRRFDEVLAGTLATDPYGHGSSPVGGERDRRDATVDDVIIRYYVSGSVSTVTVVRVIRAEL